MTVNYFLKCPVCGSVTRMRTPAGYMFSTPVRIHCGNCSTLLTGEFISDNTKIKAYYKSGNCEEVEQQAYQYFGEASGEMICNKLETNLSSNFEPMAPFKPSPVFDFMTSMDFDVRDDFIDYACYTHDLSKNFDSEQIKYNLFLNNNLELIRERYKYEAQKVGYKLDSDIEIFRFIYYSLFFDCGGIFKKKEIHNMTIQINEHIRHLNFTKLQDFITELSSINRIEIAQRKLFEIMFAYIKISQNLIPAIGVNFYNDPTSIDKENLGISTCTFEDIKTFYQDVFETLAEFSDIVIGLDNIENRGAYNNFKTKLDMQKFRNQKKGNKITFLDCTEFFSKTFKLSSTSNELRNAIGHNDFEYDGVKQELKYTVQNSGKAKNVYLLDIAIECVNLTRSAYILIMFLYQIKRYINLKGNASLPMHPLLYSRAKNQSHCPCGSGKKYNRCCKGFDSKLNYNKTGYPHKANTMMDIKNTSKTPFVDKSFLKNYRNNLNIK
ncbi:MAG: SEC-C domain-containing protein [Clostridia bacterium]|nr:SEC-C domain-containing protein [Clostridia bacterium]